MKIAELVTGLRYMITNEQKEFIDMLKQRKTCERHNLDERQQRLAEDMTRSGLLNRVYNEDSKTISYTLPNRF